MKNTPIFGLFAKGDSMNGGSFRMWSRRLFTARQLAEDHIPEFFGNCCDESKIECAAPETLKIAVIEYELSK